jgi:hypothetical protein
VKDFVRRRELISDSYFKAGVPVCLSLKKGRTSVPECRPTNIMVKPAQIYDGPFFVPENVKTETKNVSQLGLKELWVGGTAMHHSRWEHSIGAFNVGILWLSALRQTGRVPRFSSCFNGPLQSWPAMCAAVGTALLLHDYGHLPFSHLLDEVLTWMHWVPDAYEEWGSEAAVLHNRFLQFDGKWEQMAEALCSADIHIQPQEMQQILELLILGNHGLPWIQAIVNSPIDADKIDYIRFDSEFLRRCDFGIGQRLHLGNPNQWLTDFLQEQEVNHAGNLCLNGRSAVAAADLWRERISMYDRFYLAPELRVPERMAFEIVQQFLIRTTMSSIFAKRATQPPNQAYDVADRRESLGDSVTPKYQAVCAVMQKQLDDSERPELEFTALNDMHSALQQCKGIDAGYREFLSSCFGTLSELAGKDERRKSCGK